MSRDWTPILHDVVPSVVYAGQRVDWYFDIMNVHDNDVTPSDYPPAEELKIAGTQADWEGLMDNRNRLGKFDLKSLATRVGSP